MNSAAAEVGPAPRTRPRNRRALIVTAASVLFAERGYDHASMGDIAEAVGIGSSAVYRHFSSKQQLMCEVVLEGVRPVREMLVELDLTVVEDVLPRLASHVLDHRELGVLWQREARYLSPEDRARLRGELHTIGSRLGHLVRAARPEFNAAAADLIGWSVLSTLLSPSFHQIDLPRPQYEALMADLAAIVLDTAIGAEFGATPAIVPTQMGLSPAARREAILAQAVGMFAKYGYSHVGIEDIGAAVGIAGPSVYNHFPGKLDILATALTRGSEYLRMTMADVYAVAADPRDALTRLANAYVAFTLEHPDLIDLLVGELDHLPTETRDDARKSQHEFIAEWVHLFQSVYPGLDATVARIRVHAVLTVANDIARTAHLRRNADTAAALRLVVGRLLFGSV